MNEILKKTHKKSNIELLKARDYYFDFSKSLNLLKTIVALIPPFAMVLTYMLPLIKIPSFLDNYGEIIVSFLTAVVWFLAYFIDYNIQKYTDISNYIRMLYDHDVLGLKYNPHMYRTTNISNYISAGKKVKNSSKYEVWYSEVFSDNQYANIFCCQMDNLLYAKHAYKKARQFYFVWLTILSVIVIFAVTTSLFCCEYLTAILIVFSVTECYDVYINKITKLNAALDICEDFCQYAKDITLDELNDTILEQAQDIINENRKQCIFLPRAIRNLFLEDDNPFYRELNEYKHSLMGDNAKIPETADDIGVVYEDGSDSISLREIQNRLAVMFEKVVKVFDDNNIEYMLDGGTLIGAMRQNTKGFIPWDDDIDITIPVHQIEKAKSVLREQLNYVIQDAESEPFYSTRLSSFRIREQNNQSMISEKESMLYEKYQHKGIFIDVYAFSPILISKPIDAAFRKLFIHPMNRKLKKIENHYPSNENKKLQIRRFLKAKKQHLCLLNFYQKHSKNSKWYAYYPGYIYNLSKAGPYHAATELYSSEKKTTLWEGKEYYIPADPNAVLQAYYGENWQTPLFFTKKELVKEYGDMWYSKAPTKITVLKHVSNIIFYNR